MASDQYSSSDLTSVLKTLSSLANPSPQGPSNMPNHIIHHQTKSTDNDLYEPPESMHQGSSYLNTGPLAAGPPQPSIPNGNMPPATKQTSDIVDSSTITTWPAALRYVMRTVSQNEELQRKIRRLIQSQHNHEKQWWQGRETLVEKQRARVEKKKELDVVLRSVGAPVDTTKEVSTVEENQAELKNYDAKVYKASIQMAEALTLELRTLGIPFFSIRQSFISDRSPKGDQLGQSGNQPTVLRSDLSAFQRRMLELLQDLCKE
ncbi:hypothetical protein PHISCL_08741 [Aspergillus sclerotialis]|uniref:Uncharacterized protein n=1 Tax=Aspergillus sclerotialis TaxID=2070753 RepID=A0A3A2Z9M3_9EURO|nr:hypothetical protein PHISCL_08741 [Aspergillus sclerotialis]